MPPFGRGEEEKLGAQPPTPQSRGLPLDHTPSMLACIPAGYRRGSKKPILERQPPPVKGLAAPLRLSTIKRLYLPEALPQAPVCGTP